MKVSFLTENITNYISLINKSLPTNSQLPILSNIYLEADKNGLILRATDMEKGIEVIVPAKTEKEGSITVPGKEFLEVLNSLPKDKAIMELDGEKLRVKCRGSNLSFNTISAKEFPQLYKSKGVNVALFKGSEFREIFSYLVFCVSQEETRPQLAGVYIENKNGSLNFVATDGFRLSVVSGPAFKNSIEGGVIVDAGLINEVLMLKEEGNVVLKINRDDNQILFDIGDVTLVGRMINGNFPDYERVVPKKSKSTIVFDREQALQSIRLSSVFAKDESNIVSIDVSGGVITFSTATKGVGEGESRVEGRQSGEDNYAAFNVKYLQDLIKTVSEDEIIMGLNSATEPAIFEVKGKSFKHVIMPIQTQEN